ncbi:hypothetical protein B0A56_03845 [Flavobacterium columnare NBRC 100251 = ATCC 23463]|nr:hypothetical protein B0A56_03845 [Flavobacterium columnare NBRC 100251 = ATCC 23463]
MGCDISILSKHNLNITNVETLAIDLADRLNLNIDYGYYATKEYSNLLGVDFENELIELGSIRKTKADARYLLVDENFQKKQLYEKYGDSLFDNKEYWSWYKNEMPNDDEIAEEKKDIALAYYFLDSVDSTNAEGYLNIHDEILMNDLYYFSRWWSFCGAMQTNDGFDDRYTQTFRKKIMNSTLALGGDKAYFVNDQCNHLKGVGQGNEIYYNWNELEEFINSRPILEVISISKIALDPTYKNEVSKKTDRNLAFVDDFKDIIESKK